MKIENEIKKNGKSFKVCKVVLQRNYLDRNDRWQSTSSLDVNDVPKANASTPAWRVAPARREPRPPGFGPIPP